MRSSAATSKVTAGDVWDFNPFKPFNCHQRQQKIIVSIEWVTTSCHTFVTPLESNDDVAEFQGIEIISNCDGYYSISFFQLLSKCLPQPRLRSNMQTPTSKTPPFFFCQNADMDEFQTLKTSTSPSAARSKSMYSMPQMQKKFWDTTIETWSLPSLPCFRLIFRRKVDSRLTFWSKRLLYRKRRLAPWCEETVWQFVFFFLCFLVSQTTLVSFCCQTYSPTKTFKFHNIFITSSIIIMTSSSSQKKQKKNKISHVCLWFTQQKNATFHSFHWCFTSAPLEPVPVRWPGDRHRAGLWPRNRNPPVWRCLRHSRGEVFFWKSTWTELQSISITSLSVHIYNKYSISYILYWNYHEHR